MSIAYPTRSGFLDACEAAINEFKAELQSGGAVRVCLPDAGYDGRVNVTIDPADRTGFATDWESPDPT